MAPDNAGSCPTANIKLPLELTGPADLNRLIREFENLDDFFRQASIRKPSGDLKLPKLSRMMDEFIALNSLDLVRDEARQALYHSLGDLKLRAPVIHISFAADPSGAFMAKIIAWLRANIHSQLLITIGLEPSLAAGCVVRTTNKQFDFSLRRHFNSQREVLLKLLVANATDSTGDVQYV